MRLSFRNGLLLAGVATSAFALCSTAQADSFTIVNGQTVTTTQTLNNAGDTGTVQAGGAIAVTGTDNAIEASAEEVTINNHGMVSSAGIAGSTIHVTSAKVTINNFGTVTNSGAVDGDGNPSQAIGVTADHATINNYGTAQATGNGGAAISVQGDSEVTNAGGLLTGTDGYGILGFGSGNTFTNTDTGIITVGGNAIGIYFLGGDGKVVNRGLIGPAEAAQLSTGVDSGGYKLTLTNEGTISTRLGVGAGDGSQVTNSGKITASKNAVEIGDNGKVINTGTLISTADGSDVPGSSHAGFAIYGGNNDTITNSGLIQSLHNDAISVTGGATVTNQHGGTIKGAITGIQTVYGGNTITNAGTVQGGSMGVQLQYGDSEISNTGTISGRYGIRSFLQPQFLTGPAAVTITNSGSIIGKTAGTLLGTGISIELGKANILNQGAGTISGTEYGINLAGNDNTMTNRGLVEGGVTGLKLAGDNSTINNYGRIIGGTNAVEFTAGNNTLNLFGGSYIQGLLDMGASSNELDVGIGIRNSVLAYSGDPTLDLHGQVHQIVDKGTYKLLYLFSDLSFAAPDDQLTSALTGELADAVDGRLTVLRKSNPGLQTAMNGQVIQAAADTQEPAAVWMQALGTARSQNSNGDTDSNTSLMGGFVIGADAELGADTRAGLFGGASTGQFETDDDSQSVSSDSVFGGVYLGHEMGSSFANFAVTGGWNSYDGARQIGNSVVSGGIETIKGDYDGWMVSPSLALGTDVATAGGTLTPSVRLRYTGLFLDNYTETGSVGLTIGDRRVDIFDARAELAYAVTPAVWESGSFMPVLRAGIDRTLTDADKIDASFGTLAVDVASSDDDTLRGFVGFDAAWAGNNGVSFSVSTELGYDTDKATTAKASAALAWAF